MQRRLMKRKMKIKQPCKYALENFSMAQKANAKHYMLDGYLLLSRLYNHLQINDSAYFFLQQFTALKDSIVT